VGGEGYGNVGPFVLSNGAFDSYVVYFSIVISVLLLGVEISIGTSGDCEDCVMGREGIILLLVFLDLWRRWGRWVCFSFNLRVGVIWH
jgi:hypothetical protein